MSAKSQTLFVSRRRNGRYLFGKLCPAEAPNIGTGETEIWPEHGDTMAFELPEFIAERLIGRRLDPLTTIQDVVTFTETSGPPRTFA